MSLRKEIWDLTYVWCVEANYETDKFIDELFQLFEKRIDERIENMKIPEWWYKNLPKPKGVGTEIYDAQMDILEEIKNLLK